MIVLCEQGKIAEAATKTAGIYYWKNNLNGKGYVGQSLNLKKRIRTYLRRRFADIPRFYSSVQKYGLENFTCYKVMDCCPSKVALNYWETYWIKALDTFGPNGYNMTTGGNANSITDEIRIKIRNSLRGRTVSDETKRRMSNAHRGRRHSEESRRKISETNKSMEIRQRIRKSNLLRTGTLHKEFFIF